MYFRLFYQGNGSFKLARTSESQPRRPKQHKVRCCYLWDSEVVKEFAQDGQIRRTTPKTLFKERLENGSTTCFKHIPGHETCSTYKGWKNKHVVDATAIKEEASSKARSIYIALSQEVLVNGKAVHIPLFLYHSSPLFTVPLFTVPLPL